MATPLFWVATVLAACNRRIHLVMPRTGAIMGRLHNASSGRASAQAHVGWISRIDELLGGGEAGMPVNLSLRSLPDWTRPVSVVGEPATGSAAGGSAGAGSVGQLGWFYRRHDPRVPSLTLAQAGLEWIRCVQPRA